MNIIEALKTGCPVRRPIAKHMGSDGQGWLGNHYVMDLLLNRNVAIETTDKGVSGARLIGKDDLLADDWEVND